MPAAEWLRKRLGGALSKLNWNASDGVALGSLDRGGTPATTKATMPFYLWKDEVGKVVIRADAYPSADWFDRTQLRRLALMYDAAETLESAAETIAAFGRGELDNRRLRHTSSPLALARKWAAEQGGHSRNYGRLRITAESERMRIASSGSSASILTGKRPSASRGKADRALPTRPHIMRGRTSACRFIGLR